MSRVFEIADRYVDDIAALEPSLATALGIAGHDHEMPDLSPEGPGKVAALNRDTLRQLDEATDESDADRLAREVMQERLGVSLATYEAGEYLRALRNIASPLQGVRQVFDLMPKETEEHWSNVASRLNRLPKALAGYRQSLSLGLERGLGGPLEAVCAYYMKTAPIQMRDSVAHDLSDAFIQGFRAQEDADGQISAVAGE